MSDKWSEIPIRTWHGKGVSRQTADHVLSEAEAAWTQMGLSKRQISFGIGLMDIESGFNTTISSPSGKYYGLGQFDAKTWVVAVGMYNKRYHTHLSTSFSSETNIQIAVLGNWIQETLWPGAGHLFSDKRLNSRYSLEDVAYALHNRGYNWARKVGGVEVVKHYLEQGYRRPKTGRRREKDDYEWMNEEVLPKAHRILGIPDVPSSGQRPPAATPQAPPTKPLIPTGPSHPHSSLETPQSLIHAASFPMDTPGGVELTEQWNKLLSYDPSQGFPVPPADPLAPYESGRFSSPFPSPLEDSTIPRLDDILRPNLLTSPPKLSTELQSQSQKPRGSPFLSSSPMQPMRSISGRTSRGITSSILRQIGTGRDRPMRAVVRHTAPIRPTRRAWRTTSPTFRGTRDTPRCSNLTPGGV